MIGRLTGTLAEKSPPQVLIDVGGVGYEVDVPMSTFYNLPALGERVTLLTHFVVREDAQLLFGFLTARGARDLPPAGARSAASARAPRCRSCRACAWPSWRRRSRQQQAGRLVKVPGIGKKTAERLLLELKGKLGPDLAAPASVASDAQADIVQALVALGYSEREAPPR